MSARKKTKNERAFAPILSKLIVVGTMFFAMFAVLSAAITPERYDIQIDQPAPNTIKATKDVEDTITTQRLRDEAAGEVNRIYYVDEKVKEDVLAQLDRRLSAVLQVGNLYVGKESAEEIDEAQLSSANEILAPIVIDGEQLLALGKADNVTMDRLFSRVHELVSKALEGNLGENQIKSFVKSTTDTLIGEGFDSSLVSVTSAMVSQSIRPNYFYNEAATEAARKAKRDKVEPVLRVKGEVIVSDGELVSEEQYKMLVALGIVKEGSIDVTLYYGVALMTALLLMSAVIYLSMFARDIAGNMRTLILISLICLLEFGACVLAREVNPYLMPTTLGVLLLSQLVERRTATYLNVLLAVVVSLFASTSSSFFNMTMFTVFFTTIVSGTVALQVLKKRQQRTISLLAGLAIGGTNMVCTFAVGLINNVNLQNVLVMAEWSALNGIVAAILTIAVIPLFEWIFNLVTPSKLIELSNPNQPLLRRLLLEAPGTYHHSIIVANLAEAAAGEIHANALLARVGAYYHDVGKLKRPSYFKENQMGDNPHDRTDPRVSAAILTAHTRDGVQMARAARLPESILDIIGSHHGDTPVMYFYNKSVQENGDEVDVDDFRYDGPRPGSREAAIVMLADTVEAAARSMPNPDPERLNRLIRDLVKHKIDDNQLDHCELTFMDIDRICASFFRVLSGVFHERIEYPSIEIPKKQAAIPAADKEDGGKA